jgi:hypothetical protein
MGVALAAPCGGAPPSPGISVGATRMLVGVALGWRAIGPVLFADGFCGCVLRVGAGTSVGCASTATGTTSGRIVIGFSFALRASAASCSIALAAAGLTGASGATGAAHAS